MGRASTENKEAQEALMKALDDPDYFSHVALTKMLEEVVPFMSKYDIEKMLNRIGLEVLDLEI
jgi:hypothetical protein